MAYYFLFPEHDTTLYSHPNRSELNAGSDEILEIVKEAGDTDDLLYPSRILIKFKNTDIQNLISDTIGSTKFNDGTTTTHLQLASAEPKNLLPTLNLQLYAVSQSWDEGTGRYSNLPTSSNGASWKYRTNVTLANQWTTSSFSLEGSTGSISSSLLPGGGGTWYTGSDFQASQQFLSGDSLDIDMDVTSIVKKWSASFFAEDTYPTGIINNGFLIKKPDTIESNVSYSFGEMQYFSLDTHTIHPPKLTFKWDDSTHEYQASSSLTGDLHVSLYRNKEEYNQNDIAMFRIHVRDRFPTRAMTTTSNYLSTGYFTTGSYYSIRDAYSEQEIIPFDDNFTKLSADSNGMYFKIYMKGLQPERYYRILFKHINNETTTIYDDKYYFKVVR
jgi:hypothetical protein